MAQESQPQVAPSILMHELQTLLSLEERVKVSGCDIDGISRGKIMIKDKFIKSVKDGFGFCNVVFGWDMHDKLYSTKVQVSNGENGFSDVIAMIDVYTFRRIPWENNTPFFLLDFYDPNTLKPLAACPRSALKRITAELRRNNLVAMSGIEFEWYNFAETPKSLAEKQGHNLEPLTQGMFGYSLLRPTLNQDFFYDIFDELSKFGIPVEGLHTETGPGVYEAALQYCEAIEMADRAHLFKTSVKQLALKHKVIACFMAKPHANLPGCSGHLHLSLGDATTKSNLFVAKEPFDTTYEDERKYMSPMFQHFVAGLLAGLPSIMAVLAPNVNSYKRLVENFWAPITVSYGFENRTAALRILAGPNVSSQATRVEVRVTGADINSYLALAACWACGWQGIKDQMPLTLAPLKGDAATNGGERLPRDLKEATVLMMASNSFARKVLGDAFVDHYGATRMHEWSQWEQAITTWEVKRYVETV